jgi:hypothetical protein
MLSRVLTAWVMWASLMPALYAIPYNSASAPFGVFSDPRKSQSFRQIRALSVVDCSYPYGHYLGDPGPSCAF